MCIGDWRLGRQIRTTTRLVASAVSPGTAILPDKNRVGIEIWLRNGTFSNDPIVDIIVDGVGIVNLTVANSMVKWTLDKDGDLSTRGFAIVTNTQISGLTVIEHFLPEDVLAAGLEAFKSSYRV